MKTPTSMLSTATVALCVSLILIHAATALRIASAVPRLRGSVHVMRPVENRAKVRTLSEPRVAWVPSDPRTGKATRPPTRQISLTPTPSMRVVHGPQEAASTAARPWSPRRSQREVEPLWATIRPSWESSDWRAGNVSGRHSAMDRITAIDP